VVRKSEGRTVNRYKVRTRDCVEYFDGIMTFRCAGDAVASLTLDIPRIVAARLGSKSTRSPELRPGTYKMKWFVSGMLLGTGRGEEDVEIVLVDNNLRLKVAGDKYYGGATSAVALGRQFVSFPGDYCKETGLRFAGAPWKNGIAGTVNGTVRNLMGDTQRIDAGTFYLIPTSVP